MAAERVNGSGEKHLSLVCEGFEKSEEHSEAYEVSSLVILGPHRLNLDKYERAS